jgi:hypothetical protein
MGADRWPGDTLKKLPWIVGGLMIFTLGSLLLARQGTVVTKNGGHFAGDVTDNGNTYDVAQPDPSKGPNGKKHITIPKAEAVDVLWDAAPGMAKPATPPATNPDATPPATQPAAPTTRTSEAPKRMVTPEEINRIKMLEWNQKDPINVFIDRDVAEKYLNNNPNMTRQEFARLPKEQQAIDIMTDRPDLDSGIHFRSDPAPVSDFHIRIQRILVQGCAAAGCHGGTNAKGGNFYLYSGDTPPVYYTNYLTLQTFAPKVKDVPMPLIDRQNPENSLILQYLLPPEVAVNPHPAALPYKGLVKSSKDPRYQSVYAWIRELNPLLPDYNIDLTKEPPKKENGPRGGGRG